MINKLLLVRVPNSRSSLLEEAGVVGYKKKAPLNISPLSWREEDGLSHYGYVLEGLKLPDLQALQKWLGQPGQHGITLHDIEENSTVEDTLRGIGLRINKAAV